MRGILAVAAALFGAALPAAPGVAQWSSDPMSNLAIADRPGEQVQPKVRVGPDGGIYISWFDNAAGGYDVSMQRLSAAGVAQWPHNGVLLADRSFSSTVDYDMKVDAAGNALVTFRDDRSGATQITVTRVGPDGAQQWGPNGVTVSTGAAAKNNPKVVELSDGSIVVGWSESPGFMMQRLTSAGALLGGRETISEDGRTITLSDLQPAAGGTFIALWVRPFNTSFLSSKYLYTQKYDGLFNALWPATPGAAAVVVYGPTGAPYGSQGGSIQNGYFPGFLPDGEGGAVFGWYENAGPRTAYVQRVRADGSLEFPLHGLAVTGETPGQIKVSAGLAYAAGEVFLCWTQTDSATQSQYSLRAQKVAGGGPAWGSAGVEVLGTSTNQNSFTLAADFGGGCYVAALDSRPGQTGAVIAARVRGDGSIAFAPIEASSRGTGKARLAMARTARGQAVLCWSDGATGTYDVLAQNVNPDGTLGAPACPADFNWDGQVDFFDYLDFVEAFAAESAAADVNADFQVDFFDYLDFVAVYAEGCD